MGQNALTAGAAEIVYQEPAPAPDGAPVELQPGLWGVRARLPFALDHVNLWLLRDGRGWAAIDAGLADDRGRAVWEALFGGLLADAPVARVLVTHFHPDHMGLAGWLCARTGAALWTSRTEWLEARMLALDVTEGYIEAGRTFDRLAGLAPEQIEARAQRGNLYRTRVSMPPSSLRHVRGKDVIRIDGAPWRVLIGRGHAPEMICLFSAERNVLIAGDQVLPKISPNVSVWPSEPLADPLDDFLRSLEAFRALPEDVLVLPSHGRPFRGLRARIDQLVAHHEERLDQTLAACARPASPVDLMAALFDRTLDLHQLGFALGESIAHANHLVTRGAVERYVDEAGLLRFARR